jgi:hypothetical protein
MPAESSLTSSEQQAPDLAPLFLFLDAVKPFQVDCLECGVMMSPGREPVSHGCCEGCKPALRARMGISTKGSPESHQPPLVPGAATSEAR